MSKKRIPIKKILLAFIAIGCLFIVWDVIIVFRVRAKPNAVAFKNAVEKYIEESGGNLPSSTDWVNQVITYMGTDKEIVYKYAINKALISKNIHFNEIPSDFVIFFETKNARPYGTIDDIKLSWHFQFFKSRKAFIVTKNEIDLILKETSSPEKMIWELN